MLFVSSYNDIYQYKTYSLSILSIFYLSIKIMFCSLRDLNKLVL